MIGPLTDASGAIFTAENPSRRIVSLVPSVTETLFSLELGEAIVGVTTF
jgi:ABC-type hemin transport system substrate-binding protein